MNDIRNTINILEAKNKETLSQVKLPYSRAGLAPVLSKALVDYHYGTLYKNYVDKFNNDEGDSSFNEAGAYLHGLYFSQFSNPNARNETSKKPTGAVLNLINSHFKTVVDFKKAIKDECLKLQGSGWVYLSRGGQIKTIHNHSKRSDIVLLIDMWEHAFNLDYHANKEKYVDNLWKIIDWNVVTHRI
jgi:Fe-Mn family superoxide dismutase